MEDEEEGKEEVEYIVGGEHLKNLAGLNRRGEDNNGGVVGQPGVHPGQGKHDEGGITDLLVLGVLG